MTRAKGVLAAALFLLAACASEPAVSEDPLSGTWSGDYGPGADRRQEVKLELKREGANLDGTVTAGFVSLPLSKASFRPETGAITLEFDARDDGETVRFTIEGKVEGNTITGNWSRGGQRGDFRVTRE